MGEAKGVVCVLIAPEGDVVAHAADFKPDRPGGFTTAEAQRIRARDFLTAKAVEVFCGWRLSKPLSPYTKEKIMEDLRDNGWKTEYIFIGHEDENE